MQPTLILRNCDVRTESRLCNKRQSPYTRIVIGSTFACLVHIPATSVLKPTRFGTIEKKIFNVAKNNYTIGIEHNCTPATTTTTILSAQLLPNTHKYY